MLKLIDFNHFLLNDFFLVVIHQNLLKQFRVFYYTILDFI